MPFMRTEFLNVSKDILNIFIVEAREPLVPKAPEATRGKILVTNKRILEYSQNLKFFSADLKNENKNTVISTRFTAFSFGADLTNICLVEGFCR